ncbi:MAG: nicotinate phosphoribosyltransferase [Sporomusaceae bacterium]|nr:nicotinate phosphoribosyltransferase [Sporomusaceae bacterium]
MSVFNGQRLNKAVFKIDAARMRTGWYTDAYFSNIAQILQTLSQEGYRFSGESDISGVDCSNLKIGDIIVEMQFFTRRRPVTLVAGVDEALALFEECTGYFDADGKFVNTFHQLDIEAVHDGTFAAYDGDPLAVQPVLKVRGRYRDFARLETPVLGVLTEASRLATNVYNVLEAANGKNILFFPARFAHYKLQALHGYAYSLAVQAYNHTFGKTSSPSVSTDDQGEWWGGKGGGTIAHASIASFLGDTAETMMQFARIMPVDIPRIVLVDFHNDCVGDTLRVMEKMFAAFWRLQTAGRLEEAAKYRLFGVRTDTSGNMKDASIVPLGDEKLDMGVNPRLVWNLRNAIDAAYERWDLPAAALETARDWCKEIKIVVTGGFGVEKISRFERHGVPVDIYGVGSSLLENSDKTSNDFTADIVRVNLAGEDWRSETGSRQWHMMAKIGRGVGVNPNLEPLR